MFRVRVSHCCEVPSAGRHLVTALSSASPPSTSTSSVSIHTRLPIARRQLRLLASGGFAGADESSSVGPCGRSTRVSGNSGGRSTIAPLS